MNTEKRQSDAAKMSRRRALSGVAAVGIGAPLIAGAAHGHGAMALSGEAAAATIETPAELVTNIPGGKVRGYRNGKICIFKGIPYGASTSGVNRFRPPQPVNPWHGTRLCLSPGPICPQTQEAQGSTPLNFLMQGRAGIQDEDCLNLNVWTPGLDNLRRPVMVWIHGGEFSNGSSLGLPATDGEALARRGDVVVVSINHRLNLFGFLNLASLGAPSEFAGATNAGMLDIVAALQWVRDTIAGFGGDPANVTLFGQSGGGLKITSLCAMPAASGLFNKAIVQSGSQTQVFGPEMTQPLARALLNELQIAPAEAVKLREVPVHTLIAAGAKVLKAHTANWNGDVWKLVGWAPTVGDDVIPTSPYDAAARRYCASVPLMVGSVRHEFVMTMFSPDAAAMPMSAVQTKLANTFHDPDALISAFTHAYPHEKPVGIAAMINTASFNRANAVEQARASCLGAPTYLYRCDWLTPMLDGTPHAYHGCELPLVFASIDKVPEAAGTGARTRAIAERMSDAWIAFARTGSPAHAGLPPWPQVTALSAPTMVFNDHCAVETDADKALLALVKSKRKWA